MINITNVSKKYGHFTAVNDVSFSVEKGTILGLLGPNGAGKTTLMKMISGFHNPHAGSITVCDVDVTSNPIFIKKNIGYLPETNPMYGELTVEEHLDFIADSHGIDDKSKALSRVKHLCDLGVFYHKTIDSLSKGMRQRVGLAQAIIHTPPVIILDEPTSGLDPNQIHEIRNVIRQLKEFSAVILSTHILQEVEAICDEIVIVREGSLVAKGKREEIALQIKGDIRYDVEVLGVPTANALKKLHSKKGIVSYDTTKYEDATLVQVRGSYDSLKGEDIFSWAVSNNLVVRELHKESSRLESIFQSLTQDTFTQDTSSSDPVEKRTTQESTAYATTKKQATSQEFPKNSNEHLKSSAKRSSSKINTKKGGSVS